MSNLSRRNFLGLTGAAGAGIALGALGASAPADAAAYVRLTWLADVLRAEGCTVIEQGDWVDRGRPSSTGSFAPYGVLLHHTAGGTDASSSNPAPTLNTVINGRSDLAGPLCHILLDYNGACRLIAGGRANHAGEAKASGPMPAGDGNALYVGIEIDYNATGVNQGQTPSNAQRTEVVKATAAILRHFGRGSSYVRGHRETSATGKIDPTYIDMDQIRAQVSARL